MNCEEARTRFVDYWRGSLDDSAFDFHTHLSSCEQCRAEAEELRTLWGSLDQLPEENPSQRLRTRFYDALREHKLRESERHHRFWWSRHPVFQVAFGMAILLIGVGIGHFATKQSGSEVAQLRGEVDNMRQMVTLSLLQQQNASDRLRGVNWSYRVEPSDPEVLGALLTTVNHDPNINVRLAAVDALRKFSDSPVGRKGLVQALGKQDSPLVQIAILDQIVDLREKTAATSVKFLISKQDLNPDVKQRAEWALRQIQ
jgi:HEAT repeat protein